MTIEKIRISLGSASLLGLNKIKVEKCPTTCYLMTYRRDSCNANCAFCPQSRSSKNKGNQNKLSRVSWPVYPLQDIINAFGKDKIQRKFNRICIQTLKYPENYKDLMEIVNRIRNFSNIPISCAIPPVSKRKLKKLKNLGVNRIGISLDGATLKVFNNIKGKEVNGPYTWESHFKCLKNAINVFSSSYVSTHLIFGLGETHKEFLKITQELHNRNITSSLFPFIPIPNTKLEQRQRPKIVNFRKIQLARYLIINDTKNYRDFIYNSNEEIIDFDISTKKLRELTNIGTPFLTSGCSHCNRPFYTSRPSGPTYNFPNSLSKREKDKIFKKKKKVQN